MHSMVVIIRLVNACFIPASTTGNYAEDFEDDCSSDDSIEEETLDDESLESAEESSEVSPLLIFTIHHKPFGCMATFSCIL